MKFVSLFAGIGGFDLALERLGHDCVYANDFDRYCKITYDRHFKTKLDTRSITDVRSDDIPNHDILCGGFPCQAFSVAGKRRGFEDTRGTLFHEIARIARDKRPAYLFLENVKGLLSHDNGRTFEVILRTFGELGYELQWQVLNSKNFGVPQNRERVFIIGHLRGQPRPKVFPIKRTDGMVTEKDNSQTANTLTANYWKGPAASRPIIQVNQPRHSNDRVYADEGISPTLNTMGGGRRQPKIAMDIKIRRLTPLECERLQGFPEIEKSVIIELCLDQVKSFVNVESKSLKSQKPALNVEKTGLRGNVKFVELNTNAKHQQKNKPAQPDVLINCVENGVEILSQGKLLLSVHTATNNDTSALQMPIESFVRLIAGITQIVEQITQCGKGELQAKELSSIAQGNGGNYVKLYGLERTQLAKDVGLDTTTLKELTRYIMSYPSGLKASDTNLQTLFSYVIRVISGYIQELIPQKSSLVFQLNTKLGYTFGVSDTQRYKQLGNAVTVNVVQSVAELAFGYERTETIR